ncbi:hypothetical protein G5B40_06220 [Pikeienuella piscinae]|uniref:Uncharacterized protein n=1 Tax=Pikeienuella piscinae TaxID=2748098 RepID=A0A7L5BTT6_9RHOB|nr:hypothetical protein [Pikeienuella piscinae]QIE55085.1 hypothetical protein G5B40_06220 [Pikeienuella piscinae]
MRRKTSLVELVTKLIRSAVPSGAANVHSSITPAHSPHDAHARLRSLGARVSALLGDEARAPELAPIRIERERGNR